MARLRALMPAPELFVGVPATAVFLVWAADGGGAAATSLYPGALFLLGVLCVALFVYRRSGADWRRPSGGIVAAIALLGAFVIWNFLSITWADVKGEAWLGANRTLAYFCVFALFAIPVWRRSSAAIVLGLYALGVAVIGGATLLEITGAQEPELSFIGGSLVDPTGYHNATAALFLGAFFPAVFLASRREVPWLLRGPLLAAAGLLVELALIAQSRGSAIAIAISLLVYLCLVPGRVRAAVALGAAAFAAAVSAAPLLDVYSVIRDGGNVIAAIDEAATAVWISCAALLLVGWLAAFVDRSIEAPPRVSLIAERAFAAAAALAAVVAVVVTLNATGNPVDWAEERWDDFKSGYGEQDLGESRFSGGLGSNRYDFWRVSLDQFAEQPIAGIGADNFAVDYVRERRSSEEPKHPHSLEIRVLLQTGVVGVVLFAGFLVASLVAVLRSRRWAADRFLAGIAGASVAAFAYWLAHASGDWHWVFPGLTAPAFAWLSMAGRLQRTEDLRASEGSPASGSEPAAARPRPGARVAILVGSVLLGGVAAASYVLPLAAAEDVAAASSVWRVDPEAAFERLDRASDLDFLSEEPDLIAGTIAERLQDHERMRDSFEAALDRNPYSWYALLELGALDALEGRRGSALQRLRAASALNPSDPLIASVLDDVREGRTVSLRTIGRSLLQRVCERVGRTAETHDCPP